jgi:hypothetical protein
MRGSWLRDRNVRIPGVGRRTFLGHTVAGLGALVAPGLIGCGREQAARPPFGTQPLREGGPRQPPPISTRDAAPTWPLRDAGLDAPRDSAVLQPAKL